MNQRADRPGGGNAPNTRNAVVQGISITVVVLALLGGGLWWWSSQSTAVDAPTAAAPAAAAPAQTESVVDPYQRARAQIAADQVAQPAGDNAIETYLGLLASKPDDASARQALTELLPFASRVAERAAAVGDAAEVSRLIGLIERADPGYAQLASLRARVLEIEQRQQDQLDRNQQAELVAAQRAAAEQAAAATPATTAAAPVATAQPPSARPAAQTPPATPPATPAATAGRPPASNSASSSASSVPTAVPASPPPAPARPAAAIVEAEQINTIAPQYPPQALARRQEGWVDVEMVIDIRGMPRDVAVVGAQPAGVFNREAVRAAQRWRFKPRSIDGTPVESRFKRRMNFRLPR